LEKLSEEHVTILDAESARGQMKKPLASHPTIGYLEKHKRRRQIARPFKYAVKHRTHLRVSGWAFITNS